MNFRGWEARARGRRRLNNRDVWVSSFKRAKDNPVDYSSSKEIDFRLREN